MKQNETSKPCRDHEIDRAFGSRDTSRVAIQPEDGIVALAECSEIISVLECVLSWSIVRFLCIDLYVVVWKHITPDQVLPCMKKKYSKDKKIYE